MLNSADKKYLSDKYLTKEDFLNRFDIIMGELKAIREELAIGNYHRSENYDALENHEDRISVIEAKLSIS